jgi:hypothetical protein
MSEVIEMAVPAVIPAHSQQDSAAIVLVDADPKVIARALRQMSWSKRAHFLNNILAASLENFAEMSDYVQGEEDKERFSEWAQLRLIPQTPGVTFVVPSDAFRSFIVVAAIAPSGIVGIHDAHTRLAAASSSSRDAGDTSSANALAGIPRLVGEVDEPRSTARY